MYYSKFVRNFWKKKTNFYIDCTKQRSLKYEKNNGEIGSEVIFLSSNQKNFKNEKVILKNILL